MKYYCPRCRAVCMLATFCYSCLIAQPLYSAGHDGEPPTKLPAPVAMAFATSAGPATMYFTHMITYETNEAPGPPVYAARANVPAESRPAQKGVYLISDDGDGIVTMLRVAEST